MFRIYFSITEYEILTFNILQLLIIQHLDELLSCEYQIRIHFVATCRPFADGFRTGIAKYANTTPQVATIKPAKYEAVYD